MANHIAGYRADLFLRTLLRTPKELAAVLRIALTLTGYERPDPEVGSTRRISDALDRRWMPALRQASSRVVGHDLDRMALRWSAAADITAARTGLLLCNDLGAAAFILRELPPPASGLPVAHLLRDLARFSVSETYFELVDHLTSRADSVRP